MARDSSKVARTVQNTQVFPPPRGRGGFEGGNLGWLFIAPWIIGFLFFKLYPFASSLYYSFTDMHRFTNISKYGVFNYVDIFTNPSTLRSLGVTFQYALMTVPLKLIAALFIAYILNFKIAGVNLFRTAYYIPSILGGSVAIAVLWKALFRNDGVINTVLAMLGVSGPNWLSDPFWALFIICLLRIWQFGSAMVIFLAALKGVPEDLYEASTIDGAGKARQFFSITVPMITPVIFYNLVTQLVQAFQEFNGPFIITQGGPLNSTRLISMIIYDQGIKEYKIGASSALAWVMFLIVMVLTLIAFWSQNRWVYYSDETK
ncbi:MAG: sugar ABC transporter permease [Clostridiales bacterium]|nr:sugar ABC transporter permease [Clostridiales bacterium]